MQTVLRVLNDLVAEKVIETYAIGGAVAAAFYLAAAQTEDIDAFMFLPASASGFVLLTPVYEALVARGGVVEGEYVRFGSWPLQILTDGNPLVAEAIREAVAVLYDGVATRVFRPEHLCAIALQTGRLKDHLRVAAFFEQDAVQLKQLQVVLVRYNLTDALLRLAWTLPVRVQEAL